MNLTPLIRKLQVQLRTSEAQAQKSQSEAQAIRAKLAEISRILGGLSVRVRGAKGSAPKATAGKRHGSKMSAKGRASISRAQKRRWAAWKAKKGGKKFAAAPRKAKRKMSAAGRANIVAAQKKRWAATKAKQAA
ncbi:MAG: hypothetical protein ACOYMV_01850 [Verrucomicrobiia bacterium]